LRKIIQQILSCSIPVFLTSVQNYQLPETSRLRISPGSHSAVTSKGRQQISQSVVKRCEGMLVSMVSSKVWPQNGHWMGSETSTDQLLRRKALEATGKIYDLREE